MDKKVALEVKDFYKHFGGIKAVNNINLKLYDKEILAIVGDNGAGKSTLIKCISGAYKKDNGRIFIYDKEVNINDTSDARKYGIEVVYQDESLVQAFDASSNLFLGREKVRNNLLGKIFRFMDYRYMRKESEKLLEKFKIKIEDINAEVSCLSGGQRQAIVVGKAVYWGKKIIILDEPTNNLGVREQEETLNLIRQLRDEYNMSIIIISHNLYHVFELVDRIIVLKNGEKFGERITTKTNKNEIVSLITGIAD